MGRKIVSGAQSKHGRLFLDNEEFCAEDWDIQEQGDEEDVTNTCSGGYAEQEFGVTWLEGSVNYTWDVARNYWDESSFNIRVGVQLAFLMYLHSPPGEGLQDGAFWSLNAKIRTHQNSVPVRGKIAGNFTFVSQGAYTYPNDTTSSS